MSRSLSVLLTGASSFSGAAFAHALGAAGHNVVTPLSRALDAYSGVKALRVSALSSRVEVIANAPVGSDALRQVVAGAGSWDLLCLHHAVVGDYKSPSFDVAAATAAATVGTDELVAVMAQAGCSGAVLTRSVFEANCGVGDDSRSIGGYAIAKSVTVETWRRSCEVAGLQVSDFTITNPVGPFEEPRFVNYLVSTWTVGETPLLRAPDRVRDNIPVDLLAREYVKLCEETAAGRSRALAPSMWVSTNLEFARRVSREFGGRWARSCPVGVSEDRDISEPRLRVGLDPVEWSEPAAEGVFWDSYADYYLPVFARNSS